MLVSLAILVAAVVRCAASAELSRIDDVEGLFTQTNLVAWCIVPFDAKKRSPEQRAAMLERLGFQLFAYDYRAEHVPTFDAEMDALEKHRIHLLAWWFPTTMNDEARLILDVLKRHRLKPQLWVTGGGEPTRDAHEQRSRVAVEAQRIQTIAEAAAKIGCTVALYNHGGWFGEPENQLEIVKQLHNQGITNIGLVYNQHHGHGHVDRFAELMQKMKPHLLALNLNGMIPDGDKNGKLIWPLGQGQLDLKLLRIVRDSGWRGPIGILNHTDEDAEIRLQENLRGLRRLVDQLGDKSASTESGSTPSKYWTVEDPKEREKLPLYQTIPAAKTDELTPANACPKRETFLTWHRSHGDNGGTRVLRIKPNQSPKCEESAGCLGPTTREMAATISNAIQLSCTTSCSVQHLTGQRMKSMAGSLSWSLQRAAISLARLMGTPTSLSRCQLTHVEF